MIGTKIGLLRSLLWLIVAGFAGTMVIKSVGTQSWKRVQSGEDALLVPDLFDALCRLIAGMLLIFPGFISDLIAILFLLPDIRHKIFMLAKKGGSTTRYRAKPSSSHTQEQVPPESGPVIDGDFRRIDKE